MSEYVVTSGSHTVTKDGTPLGGSPYGSDQAALQAAHDDASDSDIITMHQADASTKFELGAAEQVVLSKTLTVQGDGPEETEITGGENSIEFDGVGKNFTLKNLKVTEGANHNIIVKHAADVLMESVHGGYATSKDMSGANPDKVNIWMLVGSSGFGAVTGTEITGNVEVRNCEVDLESGADAEDPYVGDRQTVNPAKVSEGGAWPDAGGETPNAWFSMGIHIGQVGKRALIRDCVVKNYSAFGILQVDDFGQGETLFNKMETFYGGHIAGSSGGSYGLVLSHGADKVVQNDPALFTSPHGDYAFEDNEIIMHGKRLGGFFANIGPVGRPNSALIYNNIIDARQMASYGLIAWGIDYGVVTRNIFKGSGTFGICWGSPSDAYPALTRRGALVGNNMDEWTVMYKSYWLTPKTEECLVAPIGDLSKVLEQGKNNLVLGRL